MKTLLVTTVEAETGAVDDREKVPSNLPGWRVEELPAGGLNQLTTIPDVTLVHLSNRTRPSALKAIMPGLVRIQAKAPRRSYVVFSIGEEGKASASAMQSRRKRFKSVATQINRDLAAFPNPDCVSVAFLQNRGDLETQLEHLKAKLDLPRPLPKPEPSVRAPRPSPLDQAVEIVGATGDLRTAGGNLSATAVALAFGVSLSKLAGWLGHSRQALHKTPDANALQNDLGFFERVARLRAVLPEGAFSKWIRMPNPKLDDKTPLDLLADGESQVVADLVDDMLTGAPV